MPDWMQTLLTIAAILAAIYLIIVLIEGIAVLLLRREYQPVQRSIERALQDVRDARKRIDQLVPFIDSGAKEPPFDVLYAQARELLKRAHESVREAQRQLDAATRGNIPEQPLIQVFLVLPVAKEISRRLQLRRGAKTAAVQLTNFNDTLDRISQIQADIKALPQKEKEALNLVRQRSVDVSAIIEAETRPQLPLSTERDKLRQVNGHITQVGNLLADAAPTEAAVVTAHGMRIHADEQLQALDAAMRKVAGERAGLSDSLMAAGSQLAASRATVDEEIAAGISRAHFAESISSLQTRLDAIQVKVDAGDYSGGKSALNEFQAAFAGEQSRLMQVRQARENILAMEARAQQRMAALAQWIKETPARFDLDLTAGNLFQLQGISDQLKALAPMEDLDAMNTAGAMDANIDEIFNRATVTRHDFEQQRNQFDEIVAVVNEAGVPAMDAQTRKLAGELAQVNIAYWGELTPERMTQAADALTQAWDAEKTSLARIKESELPAVLVLLQPIRALFNAAGALHADAMKTLTQVDADKLQAGTALSDDVIARLLSDADEIGRGSPSLADTPALLMSRTAELREALKTPAPNYKEIAVNAQRLRTDAQTFIAEHGRQCQQAQEDLNALYGRIGGLRMRLMELNKDSFIDFSSWTAPVLQRMEIWVSRRDTWASAPLDDLTVSLKEGEALVQEAEIALANAEDTRRQTDERSETLRTALAELNGVMSSAQSGLTAMSDMGSERWGVAMLDDARRPMIAAVERMAMLEQPTQRPSPEAALAAWAEAERWVTEARVKADAHRTEIAGRLGVVTDKRRALSQAMAVAEDAVQGEPHLQEELHAVQRHVHELEMRCAGASSYAEALDALTQALQHAQRFAARAVEV